MIKAIHIFITGLVIIVIGYPIYGFMMDLGMYIYSIGILEYPPTMIPIISFIYNTLYPVNPLIMIGALFLAMLCYGLYKRYY